MFKWDSFIAWQTLLIWIDITEKMNILRCTKFEQLFHNFPIVHQKCKWNQQQLRYLFSLKLCKWKLIFILFSVIISNLFGPSDITFLDLWKFYWWKKIFHFHSIRLFEIPFRISTFSFFFILDQIKICSLFHASSHQSITIKLCFYWNSFGKTTFFYLYHSFKDFLFVL